MGVEKFVKTTRLASLEICLQLIKGVDKYQVIIIIIIIPEQFTVKAHPALFGWRGRDEQ